MRKSFEYYSTTQSTLTHCFSSSSIIGLYYRELAEANDGKDEKAVHECYHRAGEAYMKAGMFYPKDDENYCCMSRPLYERFEPH